MDCKNQIKSKKLKKKHEKNMKIVEKLSKNC
jgi:hypothetical protein